MILFLIGFRATGKTTIGRLLADRLGCRWIDTDTEIEIFTGRTVPEILEMDGEAGFRKIEQEVVSRAIEQLKSDSQSILSLGGGAILSKATRDLLRQHGKCIWLTASPACLAGRIESAQDETPRPALTDLDHREEVALVMANREPVYSDCADCAIDTEAASIEETVEQIAQWWQSVDK